jgi:hypothetical protein
MSFAEDLSPQGPIVAFDMALESVRDQTRALSRAIGAVDFFGAWSAADALKKMVAFAARLATMAGLPTNAEAMRQLEDVKLVAESMLALAPDPSPEVIAGATSTDPHIREEWASYKRGWKTSRGGTGTASLAISELGSERDPITGHRTMSYLLSGRTRMSNFQDEVNRTMNGFVAKIAELARRAAIETLESAFGGRASRSSGGVAPDTAGKATPRAGRPRGGRGAKRTPADLEVLSKRFASFVQANPGLRIEQINKQLARRPRILRCRSASWLPRA